MCINVRAANPARLAAPASFPPEVSVSNDNDEDRIICRESMLRLHLEDNYENVFNTAGPLDRKNVEWKMLHADSGEQTGPVPVLQEHHTPCKLTKGQVDIPLLKLAQEQTAKDGRYRLQFDVLGGHNIAPFSFMVLFSNTQEAHRQMQAKVSQQRAVTEKLKAILSPHGDAKQEVDRRYREHGQRSHEFSQAYARLYEDCKHRSLAQHQSHVTCE